MKIMLEKGAVMPTRAHPFGAGLEQYQKEHREQLNAYSREYRKRRKENSD